MSSMFDTNVRNRREHTPWATISLTKFFREMVWNGADAPTENAVQLSVQDRHSVASRMWFRLEWTGEDGQRHSAEAQEFELVLWRAAEIEIRARERCTKHE